MKGATNLLKMKRVAEGTILKLISVLRDCLLFRVNEYYGYFYGYDLDHNKPIEPVYCEITGYGLSLHCFLHFLTGCTVCVEFVRRLSKFLMLACTVLADSAIPYGYYPSNGKWSSLVYSFDNGVIAKGFFDAYKALGEVTHLELGLKICEWLVSTMQCVNGSFKAAYDYQKRQFVNFNEWYGDSGCFHGKLAISLLLAWRLSGDSKFRDSAEKLLSWLLGLQLNNGAFKAKENVSYVFHHAHCYALEGLIYAWYVLKDDKYLSAVVRGAEWLARVQHRSGGIPDFYPFRFVKRLVTDATAQAVRIWLILYKVTSEERWLRCAERGLKFLREVLLKRGHTQGALPAYVYTVGPVKYRVPRIHTWSIMFAIQAFTFYDYLDRISLSEMLEWLF